MFLNATRRDRNLQPFTSKGKERTMQFVETKKKSSRSPRELKFLCYRPRIEDLRKIEKNDELM